MGEDYPDFQEEEEGDWALAQQFDIEQRFLEEEEHGK